jgi:hypothetical protein
MGELDPKIKIRAPLRCDGIGRLDCAEDTESGSRLAVRWLPLEANGDAAVKACEKLPSHLSLPRILQTGSVGTSAFVAMDFPEGQVLSANVKDQLDTDLVIRIGSQLSDALATVHDQGVMHGELSTESVLLVPPDRAYLWDMPLVIANRMTDRRGENRLMQNLARTAAYLAPERARGSGSSMSSDVYSLGVVLCGIAGAPLPTAQTTLGVIHLIASGQWSPRVPTTIPDPWHSIIVRMVSADPAERPSVRDVAMAFARPPADAVFPTVPEMPAIRLPPEMKAAVEGQARDEAPSLEPTEAGAAQAADAAVVAETIPFTDAATLLPTTDVSVSHTDVPKAAEVPVEGVKLPTLEMPALQMNALVNQTTVTSVVAEMVVPPAPRMTPMPMQSVQLTDTLMVSRDVANDGAVTLTAEQLSQLQKPPKWVYLVGAAMAVAIIVLAGVAVNLAARQGASKQAEVQRVGVPAQVPMSPTPVGIIDGDELSPLHSTHTVKSMAVPSQAR